MLVNIIVVIILQCIHESNHRMYTLNLHNDIYQLYLKKAGKTHSLKKGDSGRE